MFVALSKPFKLFFLLLYYNSYQIAEESFTESVPTTTYPSPTYVAMPATTTTTSTTASILIQATNASTILPSSSSNSTKSSKKGSIIFPSVKNKPSVINTTFTADVIPYKDIKVSLCGYNHQIIVQIIEDKIKKRQFILLCQNLNNG